MSNYACACLHLDAALQTCPYFCSIFFPLIRVRFLEMSKSNWFRCKYISMHTLALTAHTHTNTSERRTLNTRNINERHARIWCNESHLIVPLLHYSDRFVYRKSDSMLQSNFSHSATTSELTQIYCVSRNSITQIWIVFVTFTRHRWPHICSQFRKNCPLAAHASVTISINSSIAYFRHEQQCSDLQIPDCKTHMKLFWFEPNENSPVMNTR